MEPRISIITLGVSDLERSYKFYKDGLGLPTTWNPEKGVIFFKMSGTCLALYPFEKLAEDANLPVHKERQEFCGVALAYNTKTKSEVEEVLEKARKSGGKVEKPAQDAFWGGYSGYFTDPDGYLWEVAFGAFDFNDDGSLAIT